MTQNDQASKSNKTKWPYFLAAGTAIVIGLGLALPTLLSGPVGREWLVNRVNERVPGKLSVRDLNLSWFGQQRFEGIEITDPEGITVAFLDVVSSDVSPLRLLLGREVGNVEIIGVRANLVQDQRGVSNLHHALVPAVVTAAAVAQPVRDKNGIDELALSVPLSGSVSIRNGNVTLSGPDLHPMSFDNVSASFRSDLNKGVAEAVVKGISHQEELSGQFAVDVILRGLDKQGRMPLKRNAAGIPLPTGDGDIHVKFDVDNVAVNIVDQLITINNPSVTGLLAEAIGPTLDIQLDASLNRNGPALEIAANSENLHADLVTRLQDGKLILARPGQMAFRVTPELFGRLSQTFSSREQPLFALKRDVNLEFEFERMTLPTQLAEAADVQPTLRMHVKVADATLAGSSTIGQVTLHDVEGSIERLEASNAYVFNASAALEQGELSGLVRLGGKLQEHPQSEYLIGSDILLSASNIPTALLDYVTDGAGLLTDAVGPDLDIQAKLAWDAHGTSVELQAGSDSIAAPSLQLAWGDRLSLTKPAQIHLQLTPRLVEHFAGEHLAVTLSDRTNVLIDLKQLSLLPHRADWKESVIVDAQVSTTPFILTSHLGDEEGSVRFSNVKFEAKAVGPARTNFRLSGDIAPDGVTPLFTATMGSASSFDMGGIWSTHHQLEEASLNLQSDRLDARIAMHTTEEGQLALSSPAVVRYIVKPDMLLAYGLLQPGTPYLTQKTPLEMRIEQFSWDPWASLATSIETRGRLFVNALQVTDGRTNTLAMLNEGSINWDISGSTHRASVSFRGETSQGTQHGAIFGDIKTTRWNDPLKGRLQGKLSLEAVPTDFLTAFTGSAAWIDLLGSQVDGLIAGHYDYQAPGKLDVTLQADEFKLQGEFAVGTPSALLQSTEPLELDWTVTPTRLAAIERLLEHYDIERRTPLLLTEPTHLAASFSSVILPWAHVPGVAESDEPTLLSGSPSFKGSIKLDGLDLKDRVNQAPLSFETVALEVEAARLEDALSFNLQLAERPQQAKPARLNLKGTVSHLGSELFGVDIAVEGEQLPLKTLLRYPLQGSKLREELPALIGERVTGTAAFRLAHGDGHLRSDLTGDTGHFSLDGEIESQVLTLTRPLTLELAVTPYLRKNVLREIAPYMVAAISTERPVRLSVDNKGFAVSLTEDTFTTVRIPSATLDLGKVTFDSNGTLGSVVSLLSAPNDRLASTFNVWFTPLGFSLSEGVLRLNRVDALIANRYPIAMWGKIDLVKDRVRMVLGITGQALQESYALTQLGNNYMLQIPLTGTVDNAGIDKTRAAARITALVAQNHGSREGVVIGGVIDLLSGGREEAVPPSNGPIPWAHMTTSHLAEEEPGISVQPETPQPLPDDKLENKIKKGTSKLLEFLR